MTAWRAVLRTPRTGEELALEGWTNIQITENFDGVSATIDMPGERIELGFITELVTNVLLYSDRVLAYQLRVMDAEDTFTENSHTVSLTCQSYESILTRRILFADYETLRGSPPKPTAIDQHEIAWELVTYTQNFEDLGIRKSSNWVASTKTQDRIIQKGKTIVEAINEAATIENGFDWWIDQNLKLHAQTPKIKFDTGLDLAWGVGASTVTRSSASETYDSVEYVTGATADTTLPSGVIVKPPKPKILQSAVRPFGRWERAWTYGDLIYQKDVDAKAKFLLDDAAARRATYRVGLRYGVWNQTVRPGGLFSLRVRSLPRLDFRVQCRIEEVALTIDPNGGEVAELGARAEAAEIEITPTPQRAPAPDNGDISPFVIDPPGAETVALAEPTGRSVTLARVTDMDVFVAMLRNFDDRISRSELH
jgi:hypothetical protein